MFSRAILFVIFLLIAGSVRAQVVINEFSSGSTSDWVEVINTATDSADLSVYKLRDSTESNSVTLTGLLDGGGVRSFGFSNYLNNSGDEVRLVLNEEEVDQISYGTAGGVCAPEENQSIGRKPDGTGAFVRLAASSRDAANTSTESPCPTDTPTKTLTPTRTPSVTKTPTSPPQSTVTHTPVSTNTQSPVQVRQLADQPTSTSKPTVVRSPTPKKTPTPMSKLGETESGLYVLGKSTGSSAPSSTPPTGAASPPSYTPLIITFLLVGIGLGIIAAVLAWQKHQEMKHYE